MSPCIKILIINNDNTVDVLPVEQYEKLLRRDPDFAIFGYAGRKVRYASVVVESADRKTPKILNAHYSYLTFDSEGRLDIDERSLKANLALGMLPPVYQAPDDQMIDARQKFAKKRYDDKYRWHPSNKILTEIKRVLTGL